ncbi:Peptidase M16 N-terminal domain-containing protein [Caenorhabditis elegans]|uniref:Peptidase M16 N-terminal domain-containing protein n=1 Tax=Caenorhabditis elegans TaxID=6239 RepID=Q9TZ33_CAEEL|nr:Peptidase M16 N-terminal domain-containing protein [Caenorhabditis elegans]CCD69955.1 Peptidase M16 N-terminal domain-containing protein [Caenorhabditis elegans]|eukprot:NP_497284.1 Ubiquinol-Cytochrome c oxidoReductase complex [Caenorhabditis elegans]
MRSSFVSKSAAAIKTQKPTGSLKTKLNNGLKVVSQENNGAISQLILAFRAGSRYEKVTQPGLVHHVRNFVGRDAQSYPGLQLVWSSAASGANLNSFATRDIFGVQISVARDQAAYALSILGHVAAKPAFKPWELEDVTPTILADLSQKTPYGIVFEDIHRAAFRNDSLSFSLYSSKGQVGAYKSQELAKFAAKHFVSGNAVLVGINVDGSILKSYAEECGVVPDGHIITNQGSPFRGGDYRRFARGNDVHIMVAGDGAAVGDLKFLAAQAVFLAHIGRASPLKFASLPGSTSGLALANLPEGVTGSAFQAPYDGSGLVGVYLLATGANADSAVRATVKVLRTTQVQDIEGCKRRAIADILFNAENNVYSAYDLATNALYNGPEQSELIAEIQKIQESDVQKYTKAAFERLAISAYGNYGRIPYADEL